MSLIQKLWNRIILRLQFHTIRTKLVISFLFIGLIPLIAFALFSYNTYFGALIDRITNYSQEAVYRVEKEIDDYFSDIKDFLTGKQDYYINQAIKLNFSNDFANNRKFVFRIWEDFNSLRQMKPGLEDISLIFPDGKRISSNGLYFEDNSIYQEILKTTQWENDLSILGPYKNIFNQDVIILLRPYYPEVTDETVLISAEINLEVLADITNVKISKQGYIFITDKWGKIIYHPDSQMIGEKSPLFIGLEKGNGEFISKNNNQIITSIDSGLTGWKIVNLAYADEMSAELLPLKEFTAFIIITILFIVILLTVYLSYSISYPISELENLTQKAANNDLTVNIETNGADEIAQLGNSFNKMIRRIKKLMEKNIQEQKNLRKMEMESLDNQIKPHFIYNTLDLIIGELESKNNSRATHLIEALGNFFRLSLSHGKEMVLISSEIEHVKNYLYIQHLRHGEEYEYIIDIKDKVIFDYQIPRLVLQPLVENSIYHGILPAGKKGLIVVKGYLEEGDIYLEVVDNGVGIKKKRLEEINQILEGKKKAGSKKHYFGLRNVNQRIKLKFGRESGLRIESKEGVKTRSIIRISLDGGEKSD